MKGKIQTALATLLIQSLNGLLEGRIFLLAQLRAFAFGDGDGDELNATQYGEGRLEWSPEPGRRPRLLLCYGKNRSLVRLMDWCLYCIGLRRN